jgi:2-aminoadipate transaminase
LREWLGHRHATAPEQVPVTPGSLIGLNFVVAHLFESGGRAVVEAPTYDRMLQSLRAMRVEICAVERTHDDLDLDRLRKLLTRDPRPRLLYVLPTFHNPTGAP